MMRTYTRKRRCHQLIEDVQTLCRLCLTRAEEPVPIFTQQTDVCPLAIRIMICVGLEITNEECLPNIICSNCREMLEQCYAFRKKCEVSYQKLKSHLAAIKMMTSKEESMDKAPDTTGYSLPPVQRLRMEEPRNIYFKLDSDGIVEICDENSINSFSKHKLVSIIKTSEPSKKEEDIVVEVQNNTNTETKNSYESNYNNENETHCNKFLPSENNTEFTQNDKEFESIDSTVVSIKINTDVINVNNSDVKKTDSVIDSNSHNTVLSNTSKESIKVNNFVIETIEHENNNMEVVDVENLVIPNGVIIENSELGGEQQQGNLVINEMATDEVSADGTDRVMIGNDQNSDLPHILTTMLLDLGVLTRHGDSLIVLDHTRNVEVETGDGNQFTLEFAEETLAHSSQEPAGCKGKRGSVHKNKTNKFSKEFSELPASMLKSKARCGVCGKGFASSSGVKRHAWAVHGRLRPHRCRHCARAFAQREVMLRHELVHSEVRPFQCPSCPKSFTQRNALSAHARSHAPPHARALQLYRCPRCPKVFLYPSGLSRHTMTHSGRVFVCSGCQRVFKDKSSLKRHMNNTMHGQMPAATDIQSEADVQVDQCT